MLHRSSLKRFINTDLFETLRHANYYFVANVAILGANFLAIPIFTRLLSPSEYGIVALFQAYLQILIVFITLNSHTSVSRYYYEKAYDFKQFLGTTILFSAFFMTITICVFVIFKDHATYLLKVPKDVPLYVLVAAIFYVPYSIYFQIITAKKKVRKQH